MNDFITFQWLLLGIGVVFALIVSHFGESPKERRNIFVVVWATYTFAYIVLPVFLLHGVYKIVRGFWWEEEA